MVISEAVEPVSDDTANGEWAVHGSKEDFNRPEV
jgi:hypothetical protein